jgi:outer membrane receptor protein involved in Fe transport
MVARRLLLLAGCLILAFNVPLFAQATSGLKGKVIDKDGQPLPTARVALKNDALGVNQTAITDANGEFRIAPLPPGKGYVLEVSFTGMSTIKMDVDITAGRTLTQTVTLRPSSEMQEKVKVTAAGDVVNTETTTTSTTFNSEFIEALPILGRDYQDVLTLAPGVSDEDNDGNPTIHGSRPTDVITLVDGVSTNDPLRGTRGQEINIESIDEIEIKTAGSGADYGRGQGGFITLTTKSGGNEFAGNFKFYWRGNTFDGDGAGIDDPRLHGGLGELGLRDLKFNDFAPFLSLGGPIKKDKAWYYFTAEYIQIEEPVNALTQAFVRGTREKRVFGKVTWQMSTNHKLQVTATWDPQTYDNLGIDSFTALETGYTEKAGGLNLLLKETAVFNPNVFLETSVQHFKIHPEAIPTLAADTNHNGLLFIDRNRNGFWDAQEGDPGEDWDRDNHFDVFEDRNGNRILDQGEDRDLDGHLTVSRAGCEGVNREDVDCDGHTDVFWEDLDHNGLLDPGEDKDGDQHLDYIDEDLNHNGVLDDGEDRNENGILDTFDPKFPDIHPYIEDRNNDQIINDRVSVLADDQVYEVLPDGTSRLLGPTYPYGEFFPVQRDRSHEQDQKTLRVSGPNAGVVLNERGFTDYQADEGRITLREDLTVFVPDWHGQHEMKVGAVVEHETYDQNTRLRPILFPNAQPQTANVIQPTIGVQLPAENQVSNTATSTSFGMYTIDTYKPLPNLTLGVGMRFDREATDSFGYTPFDPVAERALYDRINALGGGERALDDKLLGNNDGIVSWGYCLDPIFLTETTGDVCTHPLVPGGTDPEYDARARVEQDLTNLRRIAPSRLTQHHTSTTLAAAGLASLFPEAVRVDPVTGDQIIDREVLRERGAATFQEREAFRLTNNNFAPRLSVSWDPWADSKTKVFANFGRYYDRLFLAVVVPEEGPDVIFRYYLKDADGVTANGIPDSGIGNPIAKAPPSTTQVDRGLQTPFSDELTLGFVRELAPEISLSVTYINKNYRDQLQDRDINHSLRFHDGAPLDAIGKLLVSGGSGASSTRVKDGRPDLYIHNFFFNGIYHLGNINQSHYHGIEVQVTKRLSRKWQMDASYTYSRNVGFADSFDSANGDDPATVNQTFGYQTDDQRHVVKFNAVSYLPHDWQVGGTASWSSGLPYSVVSTFLSLDNFDFPQFRFLYGYTPGTDFVFTRRNDQRNDPVLNINLHAEKALVLGKLNSKLSMDVLNVLNSDALRIFTYEPAASDRGGALQIDSERRFGRRFQVGFQFEF